MDDMNIEKRIMSVASEQGVAMITVIVLAAVLMMLGAGMYYIAAGEQTMTRADQSGGQAFYFAEGGIENTIDILKYVATEEQLTQPRDDDSDNGYGYLMDPDPDSRQDPDDPLVMGIGDESFTVWVDMVDEDGDHCEGCGLDITSDDPAYLLITAEGSAGEGYRKLQQLVRVEPTHYPLTLFVDGDAEINGTPEINNQSIYVDGDIWGREKIDISGNDLVSGDPAGAFATGTIYAKSNNGNSQIYDEDGDRSSYWDSDFQYDRDERGPDGDTFSGSELRSYPGTSRLSSAQLAMLKRQAQASGYYESADGGFTLRQNDLPNREGNVVIYIEFPDGDPEDNEVNLKFTWPDSPYTSGKAFVIIENGSVKLTGSAIGDLQGVIYCPDGPVTAHGAGGGNFTGFVWGKGMVNIGNFPFNMTQDFLDDPPYFTWSIVREASWTEVDR